MSAEKQEYRNGFLVTILGVKVIPRRRIYATNADRQRAYRKRVKMNVHFQSVSQRWETPADFFNELDAEFHFTLDVCALSQNAKCGNYFTPKTDGLKQEWAGVCWCNPPYGREIGAWVRKACESAQAGATVVCLLPACTDTAWWHNYVLNAAEVRFLRGRLKFGGSENSAPFPSVVIIFRPLAPETSG